MNAYRDAWIAAEGANEELLRILDEIHSASERYTGRMLLNLIEHSVASAPREPESISVRDARLAEAEDNAVGVRPGTLGYKHEMKQERRLEALEARLDALPEWTTKMGDTLADWASHLSEAVGEALLLDAKHDAALEKSVVQLADALNQFALTEEDIVARLIQSFRARHLDSAVSRTREHHSNLRKLRDTLGEVLDRHEP